MKLTTYHGKEAPRQIAWRIAKLKTVEERRSALDTVLPEFKELVKAYLVDWFKYGKQRKSNADKYRYRTLDSRMRRVKEALGGD